MSLNACQSTLQYMVCGKCDGDMSKKKGHWQEGAGMGRSEVAFVESSEWPVLFCGQRICGKFHYVLELLQQMERLFTHQTDKQRVWTVHHHHHHLLGNSTHPCQVSKSSGLRLHDHHGWVSCVVQCSGEPQWCGQALWKYSCCFFSYAAWM